MAIASSKMKTVNRTPHLRLSWQCAYMQNTKSKIPTKQISVIIPIREITSHCSIGKQLNRPRQESLVLSHSLLRIKASSLLINRNRKHEKQAEHLRAKQNSYKIFLQVISYPDMFIQL